MKDIYLNKAGGLKENYVMEVDQEDENLYGDQGTYNLLHANEIQPDANNPSDNAGPI